MAYREKCAACVVAYASNQPTRRVTYTQCGDSNLVEGKGLLSALDLRAVETEMLLARCGNARVEELATKTQRNTPLSK
jgi:hypothetical protein